MLYFHKLEHCRLDNSFFPRIRVIHPVLEWIKKEKRFYCPMWISCHWPLGLPDVYCSNQLELVNYINQPCLVNYRLLVLKYWSISDSGNSKETGLIQDLHSK